MARTRGASAIVGDLADLDQTRAVADQVNQLGPVDAVIHNAGVLSQPSSTHTMTNLTAAAPA